MSSGHIVPGPPPRPPRGPPPGGDPLPGGDQPPSRPSRPSPPEPSHAERARTLVAAQTRGALSTLALHPPGTPFGSVVTFGLDPAGNPWLFVSTMAEHTRNLDADPRASLLVAEGTPAGADPLASARVTLLGTVAEVADPEERSVARAAYLTANPSAFYVDYGDFRCLRLTVGSVRYVGGFGRMSWVDRQGYASARPDPLASSAAAIVGHMNAEHADALVTLCHRWAGRTEVVSASMTAVDRYGFEVVAEDRGGRRAAVRIGFRAQQETADGVRRELIGMLRSRAGPGPRP